MRKTTWCSTRVDGVFERQQCPAPTHPSALAARQEKAHEHYVPHSPSDHRGGDLRKTQGGHYPLSAVVYERNPCYKASKRLAVEKILKRPTWQLFALLVVLAALVALAASIHFYGLVAMMCWTGLGFLALFADGCILEIETAIDTISYNTAEEFSERFESREGGTRQPRSENRLIAANVRIVQLAGAGDVVIRQGPEAKMMVYYNKSGGPLKVV